MPNYPPPPQKKKKKKKWKKIYGDVSCLIFDSKKAVTVNDISNDKHCLLPHPLSPNANTPTHTACDVSVHGKGEYKGTL